VGLTFVSAAASQGTYNALTGIWNIGALAVGASATLQIVVTVTGTTPAVNTAARSASTPVDPNPANDSASSTVTGSTVPGLPNNGVPPVASVWPPLAAAILVIVLSAAGLRRRSIQRRP
jgi:hypothetical protein